jgi:hypothetical protein
MTSNKTQLKELNAFDSNEVDNKYKANVDKSQIGFDLIESGVRNTSNGLNQDSKGWRNRHNKCQ